MVKLTMFLGIIPRRCLAGSLLILLCLLACVPAFAATFEKLNGGVYGYVTLRIKSDAPGVEIVILDRSGQKVRSRVVEIRDGVAKYDVSKYMGPFKVQLRDLTEKELREHKRKRAEEAEKAREERRKLEEDLNVGGIVAQLIVVFILPMLFIVFLMRKERKKKKAVVETTSQIGLRPVPDLLTVTGRVFTLLQPLAHEKPEMAFPLSVGGHDAFLYEWWSATGDVQAGYGAHTIHYHHAYIVLGPGAPYLRVTPKGLFPNPADEFGGPDIGTAEDPDFYKTFRVQGTDEGDIRRYLGGELRRFLLAQGTGCRFHAGPEGVALVLGGRMHSTEAHHVKGMLEGLATVTESAARR